MEGVGLDIYLDFEMDKVINGEGNIISIGAVKVKNGVIIDTFESLISFSPLGGAVSVETTMLTGIKDSDLIQKPFFPKVFGNFMSWSQDCKRIYCWDSADISSLYYTINQNSYMIKKENLFKGFDSFIQDKFIDLKPYITYINPITQRMSLSTHTIFERMSL